MEIKTNTIADFFGKIDKKELFIVFLLFLLAFGVRGHMMVFEYIWEFDTYYHARMAGEVIKNFAIPKSDPLSYYHMENAPVDTKANFFWIFTAAIYKIFTLGAPYQKEVWLIFIKALPAIFGALISVAMYFLGKEMYGKKAGIVMAFFAAVVPSFVYRTMAGQFEEDSLGFLWLVIGFVFFVRAIKSLEVNKKTVYNAVLSGVFFGIMAWTWEMFLMIPLIFFFYLFWSVIIFWFKNQSKEKILNFGKIFAISFLTFSFLAIVFSGTLWMQRSVDYVANYIPISKENIDRPTYAAPDNVLAVTVGEENTGRQFFGEKYNALIIFPVLAFFLIPYRIFKHKDDHLSLIIFLWAGLTLFM
ncbi:MAG: glycosyltransferase family 39 protein, partial [Candidatus Diapherotrites archaeon]|nr:glycosyltransferase family 39 protein [Candidatus Diapherotrites archaeon]